MEQIQTRDPEMFKLMKEDMELTQQTHAQSQEYRRADKDEKAKIKEKLADLVGKHFEVRQKMRSLEVKRLEENLKQLREKVEQRSKNRKSIVEKRLAELVGPEEDEHF